MGQYWKLLAKPAKKTQTEKSNFSDKDVIAFRAYCASKLCELSHYNESMIHHIVSLIAVEPRALMLVGDYGQEVPGLRGSDDDDDDVNLYHFHEKDCLLVTSPSGVYYHLDGTKTVTAGKDSKLPFLLNYSLKECIRVKDAKGAHLDAFNGVHPLPLLVASPVENGRGGGDWCDEDGDIEYVGRWAGDVIGCGKSIPKGFKEIKCFQEMEEEESSEEESESDEESDAEPVGGKTVPTRRSNRLYALRRL